MGCGKLCNRLLQVLVLKLAVVEFVKRLENAGVRWLRKPIGNMERQSEMIKCSLLEETPAICKHREITKKTYVSTLVIGK